MSNNKPIFVLTHPRACSTAFERVCIPILYHACHHGPKADYVEKVFMTRRDSLVCAHEPFGDSFYYGPERLGERYDKDEEAREASGFAKTTYQDVLNRLERDGSEGKRVFIKDMAYYLMPPNGGQASIAPSIASHGKTNGAATNGDSHTNGATTNGHSEPENPSVLPLEILKQYHWTFLIRHPRRGIPSYYRCTIPPLDEATGFKNFLPSEAGYVELVKLFDYLRSQGIVGPQLAGQENETNGTNGTTNGANGHKDSGVKITMLDADDLLDHPYEVVEAFCKETDIDYSPDMLVWDNPEDQQHVKDAFEKWFGFHNDAIHSTSLAPRTKAHKTVTEESENNEWREKYGEEGMKIIRESVNENIPHYEYLKQFAMKF
ncbi:hypothetical protein PG997_004369 [Apiospora hydei]|uniref:P-loop containing nucleoside triphosphate hydrolase protein n=1 Tax=Apiospora hydei TaxID=1337664 RepID=A0ABR1X1W2_9PEZI